VEVIGILGSSSGDEEFHVSATVKTESGEELLVLEKGKRQSILQGLIFQSSDPKAP